MRLARRSRLLPALRSTSARDRVDEAERSYAVGDRDGAESAYSRISIGGIACIELAAVDHRGEAWACRAVEYRRARRARDAEQRLDTVLLQTLDDIVRDGLAHRRSSTSKDVRRGAKVPESIAALDPGVMHGGMLAGEEHPPFGRDQRVMQLRLISGIVEGIRPDAPWMIAPGPGLEMLDLGGFGRESACSWASSGITVSRALFRAMRRAVCPQLYEARKIEAHGNLLRPVPAALSDGYQVDPSAPSLTEPPP